MITKETNVYKDLQTINTVLLNLFEFKQDKRIWCPLSKYLKISQSLIAVIHNFEHDKNTDNYDQPDISFKVYEFLGN